MEKKRTLDQLKSPEIHLIIAVSGSSGPEGGEEAGCEVGAELGDGACRLDGKGPGLGAGGSRTGDPAETSRAAFSAALLALHELQNAIG